MSSFLLGSSVNQNTVTVKEVLSVLFRSTVLMWLTWIYILLRTGEAATAGRMLMAAAVLLLSPCTIPIISFTSSALVFACQHKDMLLHAASSNPHLSYIRLLASSNNGPSLPNGAYGCFLEMTPALERLNSHSH